MTEYDIVVSGGGGYIVSASLRKATAGNVKKKGWNVCTVKVLLYISIAKWWVLDYQYIL